MSRYRPPAKPASKYITAEGAARLKAELDTVVEKRLSQRFSAKEEA